jgi:hypothetical protein
LTPVYGKTVITFHDHHVLRPAHPAVRAGGRLVRGDGAAAHPVRGHLVHRRHLRRGHQRLDAGRERVAGVGAHVTDDVGVEGEDATLGVERGTHVVALLAGEERGGEGVTPVLDPLDRAAQAQRGGRSGDLLAPDHALLPEPATHVRDGDAHLLLGQADAAREHGAHLVRDLRVGLHEQLFVAVVPGRDDAASFEGERVLPAGLGPHPDDAGGVGEHVVDALGGEQRDVDQRVARRLGVHARGALGERGGVGDDRVEVLVLDDGGLDPVLGGVRVARDHDRDRLPDETDLVAGEHRHRRGHELVGRAVEQRGDVAEAEVVRRERCHDARHGTDVVEVDRDDPAVGDRAAHELGVQHPGQGDVVDEAAAAGQQPGVLATRHRGTHPGAVPAKLWLLHPSPPRPRSASRRIPGSNSPANAPNL